MNGATFQARPELIAGLRRWTESQDPHVLAAVELLIGHGDWLGREEFVRSCLTAEGDAIAVDFAAARRLFDAGVFAAAPSTATTVLDFAIVLGIDRDLFSRMAETNSQTLLAAFAAALHTPQPEPL